MAYEVTFDDGVSISVDAQNGKVTVLQQQASTTGRGAAFLSPDQADELAGALSDAAKEAREPEESEPTVAATPAAEAHAAELGVDLTQVEGTGADGKITKADVAAAAPAENEPPA